MQREANHFAWSKAVTRKELRRVMDISDKARKRGPQRGRWLHAVHGDCAVLACADMYVPVWCRSRSRAVAYGARLAASGEAYAYAYAYVPITVYYNVAHHRSSPPQAAPPP